MTALASRPELAYHPVDCVEPYEAEQPRNYLPQRRPNEIHCRCRSIIAPGHVIPGPPAFDKHAHCWTLQRRYYCAHCQVVVSWFEACDRDGTLVNRRLTAPLVIKDQRSIDTFLASYPQAREVLN